MRHLPFSRTAALLFGLVIAFAFANMIFAWTDPSTSAPGGNIAPPINISSSNQTKSGNLSVGTGLNYWITKSGDSFALNNNAGATKLVIGQDGNVGIGTTAPGAKLSFGTFYDTGGTNPTAHIRLYESGTTVYGFGVQSSELNINANQAGGQIVFNAGSANDVPSERMRILANGNIGIGTTSPGYPLDVYTTSGTSATIDGVATYEEVGVFRTDGGKGVGLGGNDTNHVSYVRSVYNGGDLSLVTRSGAVNSERIRITSAGNVGIGTTAPGAKLEVAGQVKITGGTPGAGKVLTSDASGLASWTTLTGTLPAGTGGQTLRHDGTNWVANGTLYNDGTAVHIGTGLNYWITKSGDSFALNNDAGATKLVIGQDGNVGIGTTAPGAKLDVRGSASFPDADTSISFGSDVRQMLNLYGTSYGIGVQGSTEYFRSNGNFAFYKGGVHSDTALDPGTGGSALMTLLSSGYVGIGTSSPGYALDVNGTIRAGASALLSTGGAAGYYQDATNGAYRSIVASTTTNGYYFQTNAGSTTTMYVGLGGTYNGNVGIGTTTPGAKLEVAGQVKITGGTPGAGKVLTSDASGLASWTTLTGTLPTGTSGQTLRHDGTNWVANSVLYNNGTSVGIGTASPGEVLEVNGSIKTTTDGSLPHLVLDSTGSGDNWTAQGAYISVGESGALGSAAMHLTYTGDGYGYSGAGTVAAGIPAGGYWRYTYNAQTIYTPGNVTMAGLTANGAFTLGDNGDAGSINTSDWDISSAGALTGISGIANDGSYTQTGTGANTLTGALTVSSTANPAVIVGDGATGYLKVGSTGWYDDGSYFSPLGTRSFYVRSNVATSYIYSATIYLGNTSGTNVYLRDNTISGTNFSIPNSGNTYFNSGNVGIGTSSPAADLNTASGIAIGTGSGVSATHGARRSLQFLSDTNYGGTYDAHSGYLMYSTMPGGWGTATLNFAVGSDWGTYNTGTPALVVSSSGLTAAAFYYSSDLSLKKDIVPISNSLDKIEKLNGVYFNWKSNDEPSIGLIAQDVEKVFPQAVSTNPDTELKSVDYGKLVAPLIEAVKIQQGQINDLKDEVKDLKSQINETK